MRRILKNNVGNSSFAKRQKNFALQAAELLDPPVLSRLVAGSSCGVATRESRGRNSRVTETIAQRQAKR